MTVSESRKSMPAAALAIIILIALYFPGAARAQAFSGKQFYQPEELFEFKDETAPEAQKARASDVCFAVSPGDNICVYSNSSGSLFLMDLKGAVLKKLDFRDYDYSGKPPAISSVCVSEKGTAYLFDRENSKIITVTKDFKIAEFYSKSNIFAEDYILPPAEIYFDASGALLVYQRCADATSFFSPGELSLLKTCASRAASSLFARPSAEFYAVKTAGSTLEVNICGPAGVKNFRRIGCEGLADGIFMAEKSYDGSLFIGARILNNDRYEFRLIQLDEKASVKSDAPIKTRGFALNAAAMTSTGRILALLPGEKSGGGVFLNELKKVKPPEE
ncbi:MAG TPA: hypothetical protein PK467_07170 [Candidatus Wallbacteria bacterium]|nr:hypothetical protein [Candidatus Wallbacteria bacterium]